MAGNQQSQFSASSVEADSCRGDRVGGSAQRTQATIFKVERRTGSGRESRGPSEGLSRSQAIRKPATLTFFRKVDEEPRIQKELTPKFIFRRSEAQKNPLF